MSDALLAVNGLTAGYGAIEVLRGIAGLLADLHGRFARLRSSVLERAHG